ncbi:hypothetical protein B0H17DRAFT_1054215, partial [Mycena rosella]
MYPFPCANILAHLYVPSCSLFVCFFSGSCCLGVHSNSFFVHFSVPFSFFSGKKNQTKRMGTSEMRETGKHKGAKKGY